MSTAGTIVSHSTLPSNRDGKRGSSRSKPFWISMYITGPLRILMASINCLYEYIKKLTFGPYKRDNKQKDYTWYTKKHVLSIFRTISSRLDRSTGRRHSFNWKRCSQILWRDWAQSTALKNQPFCRKKYPQRTALNVVWWLRANISARGGYSLIRA